jgi:hypothetical protein
MKRAIETYETLWDLVELDTKAHAIKDLAKFFLTAMNDWRTLNQVMIVEFVAELKNYFGSPLTIKAIDSKKFDGLNAWEVETGSSIAEMIKLSTQFCNESDFDKILETILNYYEEEFSRVDS